MEERRGWRVKPFRVLCGSRCVSVPMIVVNTVNILPVSLVLRLSANMSCRACVALGTQNENGQQRRQRKIPACGQSWSGYGTADGYDAIGVLIIAVVCNNTPAEVRSQCGETPLCPHQSRESERQGRSTMSTLRQKVEAMEKVGASDLANQALQKLIHLHMQKYERHLADVQRELVPFEQQYGMSSVEGHRRFMAGELGDSADVMEWMGLYDDVLLYQERLATLRAATEA